MYVQLIRIDNSGIFVLPNDLTFNDVRALYLNDMQISPEDGNCAIVNEQNVDVFYSDMNSVVTAEILE